MKMEYEGHGVFESSNINSIKHRNFTMKEYVNKKTKRNSIKHNTILKNCWSKNND